MWTNKEISSFRFWAPQQPNDWKNEDCVHTLILAPGMVTLGMMCLVITAITTLVLKVHEIILVRYQDKK